MSLFIIGEEIAFPPVHLAEPDGLLAIGGDLTPARLIAAYRSGIFPWYEGEHILWWSPDPRFVLFPGDLRKNKTVSKLIARGVFEFTVNRDFPAVIHHCKSVRRPGQEGTWITEEVEKAYIKMHEMGFAHSAEVWKQGKLVGGLYGMRMGRVFFGESMFSLEPTASRYAFTKYVEVLESEGIALIDCQVYTEYLESFGAGFIPREEFLRLLGVLLPPG